MAKTKTDSDKLLEAVENLNRRLEDLFILEATKARIKQQEIRALLGIDIARVTRIARHVKQEK
jgi:hypothetical protein